MLHIIRSIAPPYDARALRTMFEARKRVFVDLLGWDVPVIDGRYEVDQFDDEHCIYLILADPEGYHLGSARLLPTTRPHILASLFPSLCDSPAPTSPHVYEITRFCLARDLQSRVRRAVRDTLVVALANYALESGITAYTAIAEPAWVRQIEQFGWRTTKLGAERRHGESLVTALSIQIDDDTPKLLEAAGIHADDALFDAGRSAAA